MKIVKLFDASEINEATGINLYDVIDIPGNDCAIFWWVDLEEIDEADSEYAMNRNIITNYLISQGAEEGEKVLVDITW